MNSCRILTSSPTFFDPVKATKPDSYQIDSQSLISLFKNVQVKNWQNHFYLEMGVARATVTKDWSYIAVRHTKEQIATIEKASPQNLPKALSYIGRLGIGVRGADRPGFFDEDQLYSLENDPNEMKNLANDKRQANRLREMRSFMQHDLEAIGRPFGEFIAGRNTSPPGQINEQIALVKQLEIKGKMVTVPQAVKQNLGIAEKPAPDGKAKKKAEREIRKKAKSKS